MAINEATINDAPIFEARLQPHRSLARRGLIRLGLLMTVLWGGIGLWFLSIGAWPVFGFFGLDLALFLWLLWLNAREGRIVEDIHLSRTALQVRQCAPSGRERITNFIPFSTRFQVDRHDEIGVTRMELVSREQRLAIGGFLNPADKDSFALAFTRALATAKR